MLRTSLLRHASWLLLRSMPLIAGVLNLRRPNYLSSDDFDDLRDDRVPEASQTVHPSGNPMSHSTHVGFNAPPAGDGSTARPNKQFAGALPMLVPSFQSRLVGVGHIAGTLPCLSRTSRPAIALASSSVQSPSSHALRARRTVPSQGIPDADGVGYIAPPFF
jgi:hypothetical protein